MQPLDLSTNSSASHIAPSVQDKSRRLSVKDEPLDLVLRHRQEYNQGPLAPPPHGLFIHQPMDTNSPDPTLPDSTTEEIRDRIPNPLYFIGQDEQSYFIGQDFTAGSEVGEASGEESLPAARVKVITRNFNVQTIQCDVCGDRFNTITGFRKHESDVHMTDKPHKCDTCDKRFATASNLRAHQSVHTQIKPHACKYCGKKFTVTSSLKVHEMIHEGVKPYNCDICGRQFTHLSSSLKHVRTHTGERPFSCVVCGKSFGESGALKRHRRIHTGEKPFFCSTCGRTFRTSSNKKVHKCALAHTKENQSELHLPLTELQ